MYQKKIFRYQRSLIKGYRILKSLDQLSLFDDIKNSITADALDVNANQVHVLEEELPLNDQNLVVQQYLISRLLTISFNKSLLTAVGTGNKLEYPLPAKWQKIINKYGIKINRFKCTILFWKFLFIAGVFGIGEALWQIIRSFSPSIKNQYRGLGNYVFFDALVTNNLPNVSGNYEFGIISTYINKFPQPDLVDNICHSVKDRRDLVINGKKVKFISSAIPPIALDKKYFLFLISVCKWVSMSILDLFRGQWYTLLLLREKIKAITFRINKNEKIAKQFLFHNSGWVYRPIWTYSVESPHKSIYFYFYSVNVERFKKNDNYPNSLTNFWAISTWPNYIVWDKYQEDFVKRVIHKENQVTIVGSISFMFGNDKFEDDGSHFIAIFAVQPMRETFYCILGMDTEYYVPSVANRFFDDIIKTALENGFKVIIKEKREVGKNLHYDYKINMERYKRMPDCIFVDPSFPAENIIKKSSLVISMPFTSTGVLAKLMNIKSVFYDPSSVIERDDRAAHGIPIIIGLDELKSMIHSLKCSLKI